ncbi:MAG TPA: SpoIIE family protein phosphatase [Bradyrhizobium sp.]|nr:SpoIIE family protein phosphatase [Bradyrhizobium sp.]
MRSGASPVPPKGVVEWGVSHRPILGEAESGDLHVIVPFPGGVLAGAIDGLGHGADATLAARRAAAVLTAEAGRPVHRLVESCHAALRGTCGVVLTIASIDAAANRLTWVGVGNVEAVLWRANESMGPRRETIVSRGGIVGYLLPRLREVTLPIFRGDMLVFATDGIRRDFAFTSPLDRPPQEHATSVLDTYGKTSDDALVLILRYLGGIS